MTDRFETLRDATRKAVLDSPGSTAPELRRAVATAAAPPPLFALVEKIHSRPHTVTDQDLDSLRSSYDDDQLFEIIIAAAFGAASDRLAFARRALEEA